MYKMLIGWVLSLFLSALPIQAQEPATAQSTVTGQDKMTDQPTVTALSTYAKWRDESLPRYAQREQTPHYAIAIVSRRLDDNTAQIEMLVAADMKHYTITLRPVTLVKQASGEITATSAGKAVVIDQKAGRKLTAGADRIRIGEMTTTVPVSRAVQALEVTWSPKNDTKDDPSNTCVVRLEKEPSVMVNGYIAGEPVR